MDKNTILGFILIGLVLFVFSWLNRPTPEQIEAQRRYQDSIAKIEYLQQVEIEKEAVAKEADPISAEASDSLQQVRLQNNFGIFANALSGTEGFATLENEKVEIRLSNKGGHVAYARLKEYDNYNGDPLVLFDKDEVVFDFTLITASNRILNTSDLFFTPIKGNDPNSITMRLATDTDSYLDFIYTLTPDDYMMSYSIKAVGMNGMLSPSTTALDLVWRQDIRQQEKGRKFEDRYAALHYKFISDDVEKLSEAKNDSKKISNRLKWIGFKDMFFSTVLIIDGEGFEGTTLESKMLNSDVHLKNYKATTAVPFDIQGRESTDFTYYFGPNSYALLKAYDKGVSKDQQLDLERIVSLGSSVFRWVNQYFIIPLFDFLGRYFNNYGLIIFLLTLAVKIVIFPLTYKSYMSSAKMRVLRPQVEEINAKYPGEAKAMERQKATMELYSRAGASPMSGCVPMLLQMPILIALFMFFPSAIELRHESFLWAKDLSTYDAIVSWNTYIPLITPYFGNHISLFCLLMTVTQIIYTKFNMEMTNTGQQQMPGMKAMMYFMPLMFLVFFNQYASGLTYYYFISTLMTIAQTIAFRFLINEEKLLAKLESNKKKPQKKSSFMKRLEEAQKQQEEVLRKQKQQQQQQRKR
ncbi:YidC/Oxa1 family membrane protein insertase [Parabacteroides sp. PFB2-12]|uniref:membrane protein insertase YidC n=1 Tax=unclassified Parabacteroides TaxID=2649774 RepID=UPI002476CC10|nr:MULTISPECIES: membrane protein insertase YidC [unclassified Parabacteroides]MDH6342770.1 YidC/Oxa1 family membrane protein insertase [Parabacteroides sp. PM6-13]MDH6391462.1 YidC/Oxa1 family membrane protein insertase [Parabacteroides sp. PFB2-12]